MPSDAILHLPAADALPPGEVDLAAAVRELVKVLRRPPVEAELIAARDAARIAGVSPATWHRLHAAGKTPREVRLAGSVRWKKSELLAWVAANAPDRAAWESRKRS